jgi:hypothetical protein
MHDVLSSDGLKGSIYAAIDEKGEKVPLMGFFTSWSGPIQGSACSFPKL